MNFRILLNKQFLSVVCTLNYNISQIQRDWIRFVRMMSIHIYKKVVCISTLFVIDTPNVQKD